MSRKLMVLLLTILCVHLFLLFNLRFTAWPEMISYAYLRNNGFLLYKDMIHPYPPVLTMALSILYKFFGYKLIVLKLITWVIILINDILIFLIARKLTKSVKYSLLGLTSYILLQPFLEGNQLWFDLTIVPPILLATYYMLQKSSPKNLIIAGFALGVAALTKQTAGLYLVFGILYIVYRERKFKSVLYFLVGPAILGLFFILRLITENSLADFINWTLIYPFAYWSKFPGYVQMTLSNHQLLTLALLILPLVLLLVKSWKSFLSNKPLLLTTSYLLLSLVLVYPRFSFFHLQLALAFIAILFGYIASRVKSKFIYALCAMYFVLIAVIVIRPIAISDWGKEPRFWGEKDIKLGKLISQKTNPDDKIFLLGPYSTLYVFAGRVPSKPWTDNFGWYLEIPGIQKEVISGWEKDPPGSIFWQEPLKGNWHDLGVYQPKMIMEWIKANYNRKEEISTQLWLWERKLVLSE